MPCLLSRQIGPPTKKNAAVEAMTLGGLAIPFRGSWPEPARGACLRLQAGGVYRLVIPLFGRRARESTSLMQRFGFGVAKPTPVCSRDHTRDEDVSSLVSRPRVFRVREAFLIC